MVRIKGVRRVLLVITAVIGLGLVAAPFAFNMFSRAPKGAAMLSDFKPFMTNQRLDGFQAEMKQIDSAVHEVNTKALPKLQASNSKVDLASYQSFARQWPQIDGTMTNLLDKVQGNLGNYQAMAALPSFRLFPWFFVIPGAIILIASLLALTGVLTLAGGRIALVVLGVGLVLAPVAFQMFTRAPDGAKMMSTFKTIETNANVGRIQGYFSTMAVGQGAIRLDVVPALEKTSNAKQTASSFPATTALDADWVHILNDMTPMIAAMSDSVPRYQAIRALPSFTLFPWFFVIPGVLVAGLALGTRRRGEALSPTSVVVPESVNS